MVGRHVIGGEAFGCFGVGAEDGFFKIGFVGEDGFAIFNFAGLAKESSERGTVAKATVDGMASDASIGEEDFFTGFGVGGFNLDGAVEAGMAGDDFAGHDLDVFAAISGDGVVKAQGFFGRGEGLGEFFFSKLIVKGGRARGGEVVADEFWCFTFFGLSEVEEVSNEARDIIERAAAAFLNVAPVRIHVEKATLPSVEDAALGGVEDVGERGAMVDCDGGGDGFEHLILAFDIASFARVVFGGFGGFVMVAEDGGVEAGVGKVCAKDEGAIDRAQGSGVVGEGLGGESTG